MSPNTGEDNYGPTNKVGSSVLNLILTGNVS